MTSIETHLPADVSASTPAIATWLTTADHKKVGRLFIGTSFVGLVAGLVLAVLVTFERINADSYQILSDNSVPQVLAAVRLLLTFGTVVPLLLGLSIAIVPLQLGAFKCVSAFSSRWLLDLADWPRYRPRLDHR